MNEFAKEILPVNIEDELQHSYLDYAMSVIVSRALPDIRDGLKPVHRRALYAMHVLNNGWNKAYKKSARIVGDIIGKYHPHGDAAVYHTIVRMAQPFSMRYMLVDGQGNFGSIDGDAPAAMRYTEVRMARLAHFLLADLEKNTVDFAPNYDGSEMMPTVLPSQVPNLLINGTSGIAVGMATNIPPHNLSEVVDACCALIADPHIELEGLMQHITGPDFPTSGIINGRAGIVRAYRTGRGRIYVRAKSHVEEKEKSDKKSIIVTELPYQVNKARLLEKIAELVKDKKIDGIAALRDESDKDGLRMVIELRRGEIPDVVLNNLYAHTALQSVFGINIVALKDGQPQVFTLKQSLEAFIEHRRDVVTRRSVYELEKAQARAHILEGLSIALANIDTVIALIKAAKTPAIAKADLLAKTWENGAIEGYLQQKVTAGYKLSDKQAQAILDLRLHRLTGLEQEKILREYQEILASIVDLKDILNKPERVMEIITQELHEVKKQFGDARRTEIIETQQDLTTEDLITEEDVVVTLSHEGYVKTQSLDLYHAQHRGGRGKTATNVKDEDFVEHLLIANTHDNILCFSNAGKVYWLKTYQIPQTTRQSRGRPIINLLPLDKNERINAILPIKEYSDDKFIFMATENGTVKKTSLKHFSRPRANGIIALELAANDRLVGVDITDGTRDVMLFVDSGKAIRFKEDQVRAMGRTARGVRGIKLKTNQKLISLVVVRGEGAILTATENGYGKRTDVEEYNRIGRGGQGVISIQSNERNGKVIGATQVVDTDEIMLISNRGTLVRTHVNEISVIGRNTQGVRLINLTKGEKLISLAKVAE